MNPALTERFIPPAELLTRLREAFAPSDEPQDPATYRASAERAVRQYYGIPTPDALRPLIDEAARLGVHHDALAMFLGRTFDLKLMRPAGDAA